VNRLLVPLSARTAIGVLRGQKSRFQLFGDTVNTCARLESSGDGNAVHMSKETASLLIDAGKRSWVQDREDSVELKGKGTLKTYWLVTNLSPVTPAEDRSEGSDSVDRPSRSAAHGDDLDGKTRRLVDWNTDLLVRMVREIVARRQAQPERKWQAPVGGRPGDAAGVSNYSNSTHTNPLDEVVEIIHLPGFHNGNVVDAQKIELDPEVSQQIRHYVESIASMYRRNDFHNFEHASHVCMSVAKLLSRIRAPSDMDYSSAQDAKSKLHDHTYGITSDPLTQFACVLSALIHDADHQGVPNSQLIKEEDLLAAQYKGKSVAEQHSVELAWDLLMERKYEKFRSTICSDSDELTRFRQLVVNSVLATDIMDKDLKALRNSRWEKAFSSHYEESEKDSIDRKATIVIEHLIQASDISHTMQHWTVYRRWNARLFKEMYAAYQDGRSDKDPSEFWYEGEIG
jgi:3'5'-cyclic nucleotide phosphodiesterase/Adenylate and Guanylate cyclase catalytic domain